jgi:CRISPR/Cas system CSM-associated protein Csm3 (group 7 of RAMP superfamily)
MGQNKPKRLICKGKLKLQTSLHTTGEKGIYSDAPFYVDYKGRPVLRGTSICGSIIDFLYDTFDKEKVLAGANKDFWKKYLPEFYIKYLTNPKEEKEEIKKISSLYFSDARAEAETPKMIKDSTSINRETKTAEKEHKFDYEVVPPDTEFSFMLEALLPENGNDEKLFEQVVFYFLKALEEGLIFLGGKKSAGLGRVKLIDKATYMVDFRDRKHLKDFLLRDDSDWEHVDTYEKHNISDFKKLKDYLKENLEWYEFHLSSNSNEVYSDFATRIERMVNFNFAPLMIKAGYEGENADSEFMTIKSPSGSDLYYFPGSSLKGVFRSTAEYILNTVLPEVNNKLPCKVLKREESCSKKFEGYKNKIPLNDIKNKLCPICLLFGSDKVLASSIYFEDIFIRNGKLKKIENVAINRFTSGSSATAKFNEEPLVQWEMDTKISLRFHHDKDNKALMALIFLILKEAEDGFLLHGADKYRGKGIVKWKLDKLKKFSIDNADEGTSIFKWEEFIIENFKKDLDNKWKEFIVEGMGAAVHE